jgi:hypothetical protein
VSLHVYVEDVDSARATRVHLGSLVREHDHGVADLEQQLRHHAPRECWNPNERGTLAFALREQSGRTPTRQVPSRCSPARRAVNNRSLRAASRFGSTFGPQTPVIRR